ncbi:MAG: ABC transporter permease [Spirochaetaceae bacterium]
MRRVGYLIRKEFQQLRRDRKMLPIVFIAPVIQLLILGYAANLDVTNLAMLVYDADRSAESRALARSFEASEYFSRIGTAENLASVDGRVVSGEADVALIIPADFSRDLAAGKASQVQLLVDGANSVVGSRAVSYAGEIVSEQNARRSERAPAVELRSRVWYNPELESRNFMVPGILALLLMVITMLLTSLAIVKEKELGTLEQLNVTPIRPAELILGKLAPFVAIGIVDIGLVIAVVRLLFGIVPAGSVALLVVLSVVFLLTTLGLGLFVSTVSNTQQQAMMTAVFFVMIPMFFLSGFAFPIENMPRAVRAITYVLPLRYYFVIIRGIFLRGVGLPVLWDEALALLVFGLLILGLSAMRFRKRVG